MSYCEYLFDSMWKKERPEWGKLGSLAVLAFYVDDSNTPVGK